MTFTANGKNEIFAPLFSCLYNRVKLFVFAMNSRRRYSIFVSFIYGLEEKNSKSEVIFDVMLNLSVINMRTQQHVLRFVIHGFDPLRNSTYRKGHFSPTYLLPYSV